MIYPDSGEIFHFYADKNLDSLIETGRYLEIGLADTSKTFYVTNQDKTYESAPLAVSIRQVSAKAGISAVDTLDLDQQTFADIQIFPQDKGLSWKLFVTDEDSLVGENLTDTTLLEQSFYQVGIYTLSLITQNSAGCTDTVEHTLTAIRSSYQASMAEDSVKICANDGYEITPEGWATFNFYFAEKDSLLGSGESFIVEEAAHPQLYRIVAVDSAIESLPTYFYLDTTPLPVPIMQVSSDTLNLVMGEKILSVRSLGEGTSAWDFGNGVTKEGEQVNAVYSETGNYRVWLKVTNEQGCMDSTFREIAVIDAPALGIVDAWSAGWKIYPNPSQGMLSVQWADGYDGELQITAFDVMGRIVANFAIPSGDQTSQLDCTDLPKGLYVLKLRLGSHLWHQKIMIEK